MDCSKRNQIGLLKRDFLTRKNRPYNPGDTQQMFVRGGSAPRSNPLPFYQYHFLRKRYPFRITSIDQWYPFHIPCIELCIPFNCCKCTVFYIGINHKNRTVSRRYKAKQFICLALLGPFTDPNDRFPYPFIYFNK